MTKLEALLKMRDACKAGHLRNVSAHEIHVAFGAHLQRKFWECWHGSVDAAEFIASQSLGPFSVPESGNLSAREYIRVVIFQMIGDERSRALEDLAAADGKEIHATHRNSGEV